MTFNRPLKATLILALCAGLAACGGNRSRGVSTTTANSAPPGGVELGREGNVETYAKSSIWDVFGPDSGDQTVNVNRYIWAASLDVLNFLPVQSVDPFTGVIITGYGTPPGGGRSYRATVHVRDPALDARSLNLSLQSRNGAVSPATTRAVEDAILARARQLRIRDRKL
ncbi:MAG: DUF3576 domain-containing protein [Heliomarina sp.]|uniref:DUF3576 domain-containing protein n=1 Tax=Heliomarina sp. TaxID=2917556 RepID=UPI0040581549